MAVIRRALLALLMPAATSAAQQPVSLMAQSAHLGAVTDIAVSPDGSYLVTTGEDFSVIVWEARTRRELRLFAHHQAAVLSVALDGRGRAATSSADGALYVWDIRTGKVLDSIARPTLGGRAVLRKSSDDLRTHSLTRLMFDDTGRYLLGVRDSSLHRLAIGSLQDATQFESGGIAGVRRRNLNPTLDATPVHGGREVITATGRGEVHRWNVATKEELDRLPPPTARTESASVTIASSQGAGSVVVASGRTATVIDIESMRTIPLTHAGDITAVAVSASGELAATASGADGVRVWSTRTGTQLGQAQRLARRTFTSLAIAPDSTVYAGTELGVISVFAATSTGPPALMITAVRHPSGIAATSRELIVADGESLVRWDLRRGRVATLPQSATDNVALSRDGEVLVAGSRGRGALLIYSTRAGGVAADSVRAPAGVSTVALSRRGRLAAFAGSDSILRMALLDSITRAVTDSGRFRMPGRIRSLAISPTSPVVAVATSAGVRLQNVFEREDRTLERDGVEELSGASAIAFSPDGCCVVVGTRYGEIRVFDPREARQLQAYAHNGLAITAIEFDSTGRRFYVATDDKVIRRHNLDAPGRVEGEYAGHAGRVFGLAPSADGRFLFATSLDGTVRVWRTDAREPVATIVTFYGTNPDRVSWAVIGSDGRFDTNDFDAAHNLHWVTTADPMSTRPLDLFVRDFYRPGLLRSILAGSPPPPLPDIARLTYARPQVNIVSVERARDRPGFARVVIEAREDIPVTQAANAQPASASGIHDLRLFRDGRLVAQWPTPDSTLRTADLPRWRAATRLQGSGGVVRREALVRMPSTRLQSSTGRDSVVFTAYAFNVDRVKSETDSMKVAPFRTLARRGSVFIVAIGVGDNSNPDYTLTFPPTDAATLLRAMGDAFREHPAYRDVVAVPLMQSGSPLSFGYSDLPATAIAPTRANIRRVLDLLAGRGDSLRLRRELGTPWADSLRATGPDDIVLVSVTSHGLVDPSRGEFVLLPADASDDAARPNLRNAIGSSDLYEWLREVDAGALVLVLSTCYSAAAIDDGTFRPGPMGDYGLGQLAYDKAMLVIAAAQLESEVRGSLSMLTRAIVEDGLRILRTRPNATLTAVLATAERLVSERLQGSQYATFFDFSRRSGDVPLARNR